MSLCCKLTWLLALPCLLRVIVQYPLYATRRTPAGSASRRSSWGGRLQVAALGAMVWLLSRDNTQARCSRLAGRPPEVRRLLIRVVVGAGVAAGCRWAQRTLCAACWGRAARRARPRSRAW